MGVTSLPKTVTRQRCGCDLNPGPSAPESSTLTTRLSSHPNGSVSTIISIYKAQISKYVCETWATTRYLCAWVGAFDTRALRNILGILYTRHIVGVGVEFNDPLDTV